MGLRDAIKKKANQFARGLVAKEVENELGSKSLSQVAHAARIVNQMAIGMVGIYPVRKRVIESIEKDCSKKVKKNKDITIDELISEALNTPEYMLMLGDVGLDEVHLREIASQSIKEVRKDEQK